MEDFSAKKPFPYDYRWELASFYAFGDNNQPMGGLQISTLRQDGPDLVVASLLFRRGARVFQYSGGKSMQVENEIDLVYWGDAFKDPNMGVTVVAFGGKIETSGGIIETPRLYALLPKYGNFGRGIYVVDNDRFYHFIFVDLPGVNSAFRLTKSYENNGLEDLMVLSENSLNVGSYKIHQDKYEHLGDFFFEDVRGIGAWA